MSAALLAPVVAKALSLPGDSASAEVLPDEPVSAASLPDDPAGALPLPTHVPSARPLPDGGAVALGLAGVETGGRATCDVTVPPARLTETLAHAGLGEVVCVPGDRRSAAGAHRPARAAASRSAPETAARPTAAHARHREGWWPGAEVEDCAQFDVGDLVHEVLDGYL